MKLRRIAMMAFRIIYPKESDHTLRFSDWRNNQPPDPLCMQDFPFFQCALFYMFQITDHNRFPFLKRFAPSLYRAARNILKFVLL